MEAVELAESEASGGIPPGPGPEALPPTQEQPGRVELVESVPTARKTLEEAEQMCNRIAIMHHGKLIAMQSTASLLKELGTRSILVYLERPLEQLPAGLCCQSAELNETGTTLQLTLSASQTTGELLKTLCDLGLPIADIETQTAGLEEIFLQITQTGGETP